MTCKVFIQCTTKETDILLTIWKHLQIEQKRTLNEPVYTAVITSLVIWQQLVKKRHISKAHPYLDVAKK